MICEILFEGIFDFLSNEHSELCDWDKGKKTPNKNTKRTKESSRQLLFN